MWTILCLYSSLQTLPKSVRVISGNRTRSHLDQPLAGENLISRCTLFSLNHLSGYHSSSHFSWLYFQDLPKEWEKRRFISFWPQLLSRASTSSSSGSLPWCTAAEQWPLACKRPHGLGAANWRALTSKQEPSHVKTNGQNTCDWCIAELEIESNSFTTLWYLNSFSFKRANSSFPWKLACNGNGWASFQ